MRLRTALSAAAMVAATATFSQTVEMNAISKVDVQESAGTTVVSITGSRPPNFTTFPMMDPPRFVIDFSESRLKGVREEVLGAGMVQQATCLSYGTDASAIVRVMLTFKDEVDPPDVQTVGNTLVVKVSRPGVPVVAQAAAAPTAPQASEPAKAQATVAQAAAAERARAEAAAAEQARVESERAQALAAAKAEAEARAQAAAAEQARAEAAAKARADAEAAAAAQAAQQARAKAEAEAAVAAAAAEQARAEAAAKARADAQAAASAQAAAKARADAEEAAAAQAAAKARSDAEAASAAQAAQQARARAEAEAAAAAAEQARAEAAAKARVDAEAAAAAQAAARARAEAEAAEQAAQQARAEARAREAPPAVAAATQPEPRPAVATGARGTVRRNQVREVGFKQSTDGSRVFVRTASEPRFVIREAGPRTIRVEFPNTQVLRRNDTRFLDTSFFPSAVAMVSPRREGSAYVVEITLKQMVPYQERLEGDTLAIDFERPAGLRSVDAPAPAAGQRAAPTPARPAGN